MTSDKISLNQLKARICHAVRECQLKKLSENTRNYPPNLMAFIVKTMVKKKILTKWYSWVREFGAQWLTYLEPSRVYIFKKGVSSMNLELYEVLLAVCYCFS